MLPDALAARQTRQVFGQRLRDQNPVKRIAVNREQSVQGAGMGSLDGENARPESCQPIRQGPTRVDDAEPPTPIG